MKITDQQLDRFDNMVRDFTKKYGLSVEIERDSFLDPMTTNIVFTKGFRLKRYEVIWSKAKSLTDAGTFIFADALNFFGLNKSAAPQFQIKDVIFNDPATIVFWADGTKTVVKCQEDDIYSEEVGLALCFAKKALGNKSNFNNVFKKWIPEVKSDYVYQGTVQITQDLRSSAADALDKLAEKLRRPIAPGEI